MYFRLCDEERTLRMLDISHVKDIEHTHSVAVKSCRACAQPSSQERTEIL